MEPQHASYESVASGGAAEQRVLIAFGANLPLDDQPPGETLRHAAVALAGAGLAGLRLSRLWRTPCFPAGAGPDYVNAAAAADWTGGGGPRAALAALHAVEAAFGRQRGERWGMRTLDLDLLAFGDAVRPDAGTQALWRRLPLAAQVRAAPDRLVLPHPRLADRAFVLVPLAEVAPDWRHPLTGLSVTEMRDALPVAALDGMVPLDAAAP